MGQKTRKARRERESEWDCYSYIKRCEEVKGISGLCIIIHHSLKLSNLSATNSDLFFRVPDTKTQTHCHCSLSFWVGKNKTLFYSVPCCFFSSFGTYITLLSPLISFFCFFVRSRQILPFCLCYKFCPFLLQFPTYISSGFSFNCIIDLHLLISYFEFMGSLNFNHYQMGKFQNNFFFSNQFWFGLLILEKLLL